jgi:hypothetical protein
MGPEEQLRLLRQCSPDGDIQGEAAVRQGLAKEQFPGENHKSLYFSLSKATKSPKMAPAHAREKLPMSDAGGKNEAGTAEVRRENYPLTSSELFTSCFSGIGFCRPRLSSLFVAANGIVDLATMDRYFFGGFDPKSHLVTANLNHYDRNVIVNDNTLVLLPRKDQHTRFLR